MKAGRLHVGTDSVECTRAFGDFKYHPFLICDPTVSVRERSRNDKYLISATDGLFKFMAVDDIIKNTNLHLTEYSMENLHGVPTALMLDIKGKYGSDNIAIAVIILDDSIISISDSMYRALIDMKAEKDEKDNIIEFCSNGVERNDAKIVCTQKLTPEDRATGKGFIDTQTTPNRIFTLHPHNFSINGNLVIVCKDPFVVDPGWGKFVSEKIRGQAALSVSRSVSGLSSSSAVSSSSAASAAAGAGGASAAAPGVAGGASAAAFQAFVNALRAVGAAPALAPAPAPAPTTAMAAQEAARYILGITDVSTLSDYLKHTYDAIYQYILQHASVNIYFDGLIGLYKYKMTSNVTYLSHIFWNSLLNKRMYRQEEFINILKYYRIFFVSSNQFCYQYDCIDQNPYIHRLVISRFNDYIDRSTTIPHSSFITNFSYCYIEDLNEFRDIVPGYPYDEKKAHYAFIISYLYRPEDAKIDVSKALSKIKRTFPTAKATDIVVTGGNAMFPELRLTIPARVIENWSKCV